MLTSMLPKQYEVKHAREHDQEHKAGNIVNRSQTRSLCIPLSDQIENDKNRQNQDKKDKGRADSRVVLWHPHGNGIAAPLILNAIGSCGELVQNSRKSLRQDDLVNPQAH